MKENQKGMKKKLAVIGCGFWAQYQVAGWTELLSDLEIVAVSDRDRSKAQRLAALYGIPKVYDDAEIMLKELRPDLVDIITTEETHASLVQLAASHGCHVICQKPMGRSMEECIQMVENSHRGGVRFYVHENFRWQEPVRHLKKLLDQGIIGKPFKGNLKFCSSFPVFENQPNLATLDRFILMDVGTHILDMARFLFGEVASLYCQTQRINPQIRGEDVANVFLRHQNGVHSYSEMSYASRWDGEAFPQTFILIEGELGALHLTRDFHILITTSDGTRVEIAKPPAYSWAHPDYAVAHASIVACHRNILDDVLNKGEAETSAEDNLRTLQLVFDSYRSAELNQVIHYGE